MNNYGKYLRDLKRLTKGDDLQRMLVSASAYLTAYEFFISSILSWPRSWMIVNDADASGEKRYKEEIRNLCKKDVVIATLKWYKEQGAITEEEEQEITELKNYRNKIAHELPNILLDADSAIEEHQFLRIQFYYEKIGKWWIINFELPISDEYENVAFDAMENVQIDLMGSIIFKLLKNHLDCLSENYDNGINIEK